MQPNRPDFQSADIILRAGVGAKDPPVWDPVTQYRMMTFCQKNITTKLLVILAVCESKVRKEKTFARTSVVKTALGNLQFLFLLSFRGGVGVLIKCC